MEKLCKNCRYYLIKYSHFEDVSGTLHWLKANDGSNRCLKSDWLTWESNGCDMFKPKNEVQ